MKNELERGVAWLTASKIVVNVLAFGSTLLLARYLSPEDFGIASLAFTMLAIIGSFTELNLGSALIQHKNPTDDYFHTAWTLGVCRALAVGVIFTIAAPIAAAVFEEPRLRDIMLVLAASIVMSGFTNPKTILFIKDLVFWQDFVISTSQKLAGFIAGTLVAVIYQSYWALVAGAIASQLVWVIISYVIVPFRPKFVLRHTNELLSFSVWLSLGQIINTLNAKLDFLLIGSLLGKPALGYYTVGENLASLPTRELTSPLLFTLFPGFSKIVEDKNRLKQAYKSAQGLISSLALPVGFGFALVARPLVELLMGNKWLPSVVIIQALACAFAVQTLSTSVNPLAMATGQTKLLFQRDLLSFFVRVPAIVIGAYFGGLIGILCARVFTAVISMYINMRFVRQLIGITVTEQLICSYRSFASVFLMILGVLACDYLIPLNISPWGLSFRIAIFIIVGVFLYVLIHVTLWFLANKPNGPEEEVLRILNKLIASIDSSNIFRTFK